MIGKNFIFDGNALPWSRAEGVASGWYLDVNWKNIVSQSTISPNSAWHGVTASPTYGRERVITLQGEIFSAVKATRGTARKEIEDIFVLQGYPDLDDGYKKLEFTDDDGTEWWLDAKVFKFPEFTHTERGHPLITVDGALIAKDLIIRSKNINTVTGALGYIGGMVIPATLPDSYEGVINRLSCVNTGNFPSPAKITITAVNEIVNPKILNMTNGYFYKLNLTMNAGDVLVIDATPFTVKKNGVDVRYLRETGSTFLNINAGTNDLILLSDSFDWDTYDVAGEIKIEFYNTRI